MNAMLKMNEINLEKTKVQATAVRAIVKGFKKHSRGKCIMACGTGKTRVAFNVIAKRKDAITIICVPSLGLVSQFLKDCPEHAPKHRVLPVCCRMDNESPEDYEIAGATTSSAEIAAVIGKASSRKRLLIVSTYQSYEKICEANNTAGKEVGLLIADEAHNTAGPKGKKMSLCVHDCHMHVTNRLFLTATPRLYSGSDEESASMDNEALYGPEFFQFSFKKALEHGIVCDYEIHIVDVLAFDSLRKIREAEHPAELVETVSGHIASLMKAEDRGRAFVFHTRIDRSQEFSGYLERNGVHSSCITGRDSVKRREMLLREFENNDGSSVICSVKVFGEGIDAPSVNRIVISDPMTSVIQIAQIIGRGTRVEAGKEKLIIYIPVFMDAGAAGEEDDIYVDKSPFRTAIKVLNAMRSVDESLDMEIREILQGDGDRERDARVEGAKWKRILSNVPVDVLRERLIAGYRSRWPDKEAGVESIAAAAEEYFKVHGKWPFTNSGEPHSQHLTWNRAHAFLQFFFDGLTLRQFIENRFGSHNWVSFDKLCGGSVEVFRGILIANIKEYFRIHGKIPSSLSNDNAPLVDVSWKKLRSICNRYGMKYKHECRLAAGSVDLAYMSSSQRRKLVITAIQDYRQKTGKTPNRLSGQFMSDPLLSWCTVFNLLVQTDFNWFQKALGRRLAGQIWPKWDESKRLIGESLRMFHKREGRCPRIAESCEGIDGIRNWYQVSQYAYRNGTTIKNMYRDMLDIKSAPSVWNNEFESDLKHAVENHVERFGKFPSKATKIKPSGMPQNNWKAVDKYCQRSSPHGTLSSTIKALFPNGKPGD